MKKLSKKELAELREAWDAYVKMEKEAEEMVQKGWEMRKKGMEMRKKDWEVWTEGIKIQSKGCEMHKKGLEMWNEAMTKHGVEGEWDDDDYVLEDGTRFTF